jgi:hypothetical protein
MPRKQSSYISKSSSRAASGSPAAGLRLAGAAAAGHAAQQAVMLQSPQGNPFPYVKSIAARMAKLKVEAAAAGHLLANWQFRRLCKLMDKGFDDSKPGRKVGWRKYAVVGHLQLAAHSKEAKAAVASTNQGPFLQQQCEGAGCLMVRAGVNLTKVSATFSAADAAAADMAALCDKLDAQAVVLLAWRVQHHQGMQQNLSWLAGVLAAADDEGTPQSIAAKQQTWSGIWNQLS